MSSASTSPQIQELQFPAKNSVAFDLQAFEDAISAHGLKFVHYRAMRNPIGLIDKHDNRRPNPDTPNASNGFLYNKAGCVRALFIGNTKDTRANEGGLVDASNAQFTPLKQYTDSDEQVFLAPFDRLYLEEKSVLVTRHETLENDPTGIDRPKFPVVKVLDCVDANGTYYRQCSDFEVEDGKIIWKNRRPGVNPDTNHGIVYGIRYVYRPYWYVQRLLHEIRMIQQDDPLEGRVMVQAPQSAIVQREYIFENEAADASSNRANEKPADGGLPAR